MRRRGGWRGNVSCGRRRRIVSTRCLNSASRFWSSTWTWAGPLTPRITGQTHTGETTPTGRNAGRPTRTLSLSGSYVREYSEVMLRMMMMMRMMSMSRCCFMCSESGFQTGSEWDGRRYTEANSPLILSTLFSVSPPASPRLAPGPCLCCCVRSQVRLWLILNRSHRRETHVRHR